jgi:hypothetical protein
MKNWTATLLLAACFVSTLAFGDNPSDAPLVIDKDAAVVQRDDQQKNCIVRDRKHKDKDKNKNNNNDKQDHPLAKSTNGETVASDAVEYGRPQAGKSESGYSTGAQ